MLVVCPLDGLGQEGAGDVEAVVAGRAVVEEGVAGFETGVAGELRDVEAFGGRRGEEREGMGFVGFVLDFFWEVEAGVVEAEFAEFGFCAGVGLAGECLLAAGAEEAFFFVDLALA